MFLRQENGEHRSSRREAANTQPVAMPLNDLFTEPEPKARAHGTLGGEERLENVLHVVPSNAFAGVSDGHGEGGFAQTNRVGAHGDSIAGGTGVDRVREQVR